MWSMELNKWVPLIFIKMNFEIFIIYLQFGMLIEFLFEEFPNFEDVNERAIGDLQVSEHTIIWNVKF